MSYSSNKISLSKTVDSNMMHELELPRDQIQIIINTKKIFHYASV
jgi:hypothetical protein